MIGWDQSGQAEGCYYVSRWGQAFAILLNFIPEQLFLLAGDFHRKEWQDGLEVKGSDPLRAVEVNFEVSMIPERGRWQRQQRRGSPTGHRPSLWGLVLLLLLWSGGWGLAIASTTPIAGKNPMAQTSAPASNPTTVDVVPAEFQLSQEIYFKTCGTCHLALPPEVMPTATWRLLLLDANHYGATLQLPRQPELGFLWNYLQAFSRPLNENEETPYRVARSRYFKILHPRVEFPAPVTLNSCASCHPGAADFNFRRLTPEWQNSP